MLLQDIDNVKFMLREDLGETVGVLDGLGRRGGLVGLGVTQHRAVENIWRFPKRSQGVACHHLDLHAHRGRGHDG